MLLRQKPLVAERPQQARTPVPSSELAVFLLVTLVVLLTRLPFLNAGYGGDPDSWRVANVARVLATGGEYMVSRHPGYPVHEMVSSLIWRGGPWALNGATALCSAVAVALFVLALCYVRIQDAILAGVALAFTPVFYIDSVATIDYIWALAFSLGSLYAVLRRRPLIAGVLLGIAVGCRMTSGAMIVPLGILLLMRQETRNLRELALFGVVACLVGLITFLPVLRVYGLGLFFFIDTPRSIEIVLRESTNDLWGQIGMVGIILGLLGAEWRALRKLGGRQACRPDTTALTAASLLVLILYGIAFLRLPHDPGYLMPILPYCLLLIWLYAARWIRFVVCVALVVSSFWGYGPAGISKGPILNAHASRLASLVLPSRVYRIEQTLAGKSVIVAGPWLPMLQVDCRQHADTVQYMYRLTPQEAADYLAAGYTLYYLPGLESFIPIAQPPAGKVMPLNLEGVNGAQVPAQWSDPCLESSSS